ncbi:MAG: hypothetical protein ACI4PW_00025 [Alphaproteobacteria bacterium]|jgi:hypothetical protein
MQLSEFPNPTVAVNESGRVSVFLPSLEGEPDAPSFSFHSDGAVLFRRTPDAGCVLSGLSEETMGYLDKSSRCLVIEVDVEKAAEKLDAGEENIEDSFRRLYEVSVNMERD